MKKSLAVFVHGFNSGPKCWETLFDLMDGDPSICDAFDRIRYDYQSKIGSGLLNPLHRTPDYGGIVNRFDQYVAENFGSKYAELYLIGHSQGGLIIQQWLVDKLRDGKGQQLRNIREVVLVATPTLGSNIAFGIRRALFSLIRSPQEQRLRPFDQQTADVRRAFENSVVQATALTDYTCPIPVIAFWGYDDNVVPEASAEASFPVSKALAGWDHSKIICPKDREDERYKRIADALLAPVGHPHVFEIESYLTSLRVEPLTGTSQAYTAQRGGAAGTEYADNFGRLRRVVCFSAKNVSKDLFRFNYQTNPRAYLKATVDMQPRDPGVPVPPNEAAVDEMTDFAQSGTQTTYKFIPQPGKCHSQTLQIWNGFCAGGRDVHFHTGTNLRCKKYTFTIDLSPYLSAGWQISAEPQLFVHPWDTGECQIHEERSPENRIAVSEKTPEGIWTWNLPDFRGGVVDAVWDVAIESVTR